MSKIEFFITRKGRSYQLRDGNGSLHLDAQFASKTDAADQAIRFAQDNGALYAIYY